MVKKITTDKNKTLAFNSSLYITQNCSTVAFVFATHTQTHLLK